MIFFDIDAKIRQTFGLFTGLRTEQQDRLIYDKVSRLVFGDILLFMQQNLPVKDQNILVVQLNQNLSVDTGRILNSYLSQISEGKYRLTKRIEYLLNSLVAQGEKNHERN